VVKIEVFDFIFDFIVFSHTSANEF